MINFKDNNGMFLGSKSTYCGRTTFRNSSGTVTSTEQNGMSYGDSGNFLGSKSTYCGRTTFCNASGQPIMTKGW